MKHPYLDIEALFGRDSAKSALQKLLDETTGTSAILRDIEKLTQPRFEIEKYMAQHVGAAASVQSTIDQILGRSAFDGYKRLIEQHRLTALDAFKSAALGQTTRVLGEHSKQLETNSLTSLATKFAPTDSLISKLLAQEANTFTSQIDHLARSLTSQFAGRERDVLSKFQQMLSEAKLESVRIADSGEIEVAGTPVQVPDLEWDLERTVVLADQPAVALLEHLVGWLSSLAPLLRAALLYVLLPYIVSIVANINTPLHEEWWKAARGSTDRQAKKELRAQATTTFPAADLSSFRFVSASQLQVLQTAKIRSPTVDVLLFGKPVRLLSRTGAFSLVEYSSGTERHVVQGWVLSRYLQKFQK